MIFSLIKYGFLVIFIFVNTGCTYNLKVDKGWNLVSFSIDQSIDIESVLSSVDLGSEFKVWSYQGSWLSYSKNKQKNSLTTFSPFQGYWIYSSIEMVLGYEAIALNTQMNFSRGGWYLVGSSYNSYDVKNLNEDTKLVSSDLSILKVWSYSQSTWLKFEPLRLKGNLALIEKNKGYWCKVKREEKADNKVVVDLKSRKSNGDLYKSIRVLPGFEFDDIRQVVFQVFISNVNDIPVKGTYVKISSQSGNTLGVSYTDENGISEVQVSIPAYVESLLIDVGIYGKENSKLITLKNDRFFTVSF